MKSDLNFRIVVQRWMSTWRTSNCLETKDIFTEPTSHHEWSDRAKMRSESTKIHRPQRIVSREWTGLSQLINAQKYPTLHAEESSRIRYTVWMYSTYTQGRRGKASQYQNLGGRPLVLRLGGGGGRIPPSPSFRRLCMHNINLSDNHAAF